MNSNLRLALFLFLLLSTSLGCKQSTTNDGQEVSTHRNPQVHSKPSDVPQSHTTDSLVHKPHGQGNNTTTTSNSSLTPTDKSGTADLEASKYLKDSLAAVHTTAPEAEPVAKAKKTKTTKIAVPEKKKTKVKSFAEMTFDNMVHDFGEIEEGDVIEHDFKFMNTSKHPLIIASATASCGCTRPTFPFITIAPGETNKISVEYHSVGKDGIQSPEITIVANTNPKTTVLKLSGKVLPKTEGGTDKSGSIGTKSTDKTSPDSLPESADGYPQKVLKDASTKITIKKDLPE